MAESSVSVVSNNINAQIENDTLPRSDSTPIEPTEKGTYIIANKVKV